MSNKKWNHEMYKELTKLSKVEKLKIKDNEIRFFKINEKIFPARIIKRFRKEDKEVKIFGKENFLKIKSNDLFVLYKDRLNKIH